MHAPLGNFSNFRSHTSVHSEPNVYTWKRASFGSSSQPELYNGTGNHLSIGSTSSTVKFFICQGVRSHMACVIMSSVTIVAKESTKFSAAQCRFACLVATV